MTSKLYEFKSIGNDYGVIVTWGGFMKKLTQEFGVVRRSLKARENGVKQMHGLFLSKYTITPPSGQTNHKKAPLPPSPAHDACHCWLD